MSGPSPSPGSTSFSSATTPDPNELVLYRLAANAKAHATAHALMYRDEHGVFVPVTWAAYHEQVQAFAAACIAVGLPVGGAVAVLGEGCPEWTTAALGAMSAGGMAVGLYPTATSPQVQFILNHCEAMLAVVQGPAQWQKIAEHLGDLPKLRRVVFMSPEVSAEAQQIVSPAGGPLGQSWRDFLSSGKNFRETVEKRVAEILPDQVASLIYTSGTTGMPKGVMLTHHNLAWTASCIYKIHPAQSGDIFVSYLPLSHIAEQLFSIYLPITSAGCVYFSGGIDRLQETLLAARPTLFLGVPRVWEKLHMAISKKLDAESSVRRRVIAWARDVGMRSGGYRLAHGEPYGLLAIEERLASKLLFAKLKAAIGMDRVRTAVTGAAAIRKEVLDFFLSLQLPIYEVYGQSECTGPCTFNARQPGQTRLGTVGRPIPGSTLKLAADGEILFQGPNVFAGYYKDPDATTVALRGGWVHTGDIGEFLGDGFLRITDRKKDLFKTSGGKYVAPQPMEIALRAIPLIAQAVIIGENRPYVTALLTLDIESCRALIGEKDCPLEPEALIAHEKIHKAIQEHLDRINRSLQRYETIKRYTLLPSDFSADKEEMTPTQKLRRRVVFSRYSAEIEAMYKGDSGPIADS